jgi:hypothetical protein
MNIGEMGLLSWCDDTDAGNGSEDEYDDNDHGVMIVMLRVVVKMNMMTLIMV